MLMVASLRSLPRSWTCWSAPRAPHTESKARARPLHPDPPQCDQRYIIGPLLAQVHDAVDHPILVALDIDDSLLRLPLPWPERLEESVARLARPRGQVNRAMHLPKWFHLCRETRNGPLHPA